MNVEILRQQQRLEALFTKIGTLDGDSEVQAHWARYLCVLVSGFIESSIETLFSELAEKRSDPRIANFVKRRLRNFTNAKMEKILTLIGEFSQEWSDEFRTETEGELKDAVDSVVSNRHLIAHGRSVGVTYSNMKDWFERVCEVIVIVEDKLS